MLGAGSIFPPKEENIPPPTQHLSFGGNQNTGNIRPWTGNVRSQFVTAIFTTEISPWQNGFTMVHTSSLFGVFGLLFLNGKCINYLASKLVNVVAQSIPSRRRTYPFHGGAGSFRDQSPVVGAHIHFMAVLVPFGGAGWNNRGFKLKHYPCTTIGRVWLNCKRLNGIWRKYLLAALQWYTQYLPKEAQSGIELNLRFLQCGGTPFTASSSLLEKDTTTETVARSGYELWINSDKS